MPLGQIDANVFVDMQTERRFVHHRIHEMRLV